MDIKIIEGNIFNSRCQTIVNTVNCFGVMGKGIALTYRFLLPEMYLKYKKMCDNRLIDIGKLWLYKHHDQKWILNFPTKFHWKLPSKIEYIEKGLQKFVSTYKEKQIKSIAFPLLGTTNGGLDEDMVMELMLYYLKKCSIDIEIYKFSQSSHDELLMEFKRLFYSNELSMIAQLWKIPKNSVESLDEAFKCGAIRSIIELTNIEGVGEKTTQRLFNQINYYK